MNTCKTCKFWDGEECLKVWHTDDREPNIKENEFEVNVRVSDDHGLIVKFLTGPDFGCVRHEEKV